MHVTFISTAAHLIYRAKSHLTHLAITAKESSIQKRQIFFAVTVWSLVSSSRHFEGSWLIHLQGQGPFDFKAEGTTMVLNVWLIHPPTEHHITKDLRFQQNLAENLKYKISILFSCGYVSTPVFTSNVTLSANPFLNFRLPTPLRTSTETTKMRNLLQTTAKETSVHFLHSLLLHMQPLHLVHLYY